MWNIVTGGLTVVIIIILLKPRQTSPHQFLRIPSPFRFPNRNCQLAPPQPRFKSPDYQSQNVPERRRYALGVIDEVTPKEFYIRAERNIFRVVMKSAVAMSETVDI